jgi:hypothetical protein
MYKPSAESDAHVAAAQNETVVARLRSMLDASADGGPDPTSTASGARAGADRVRRPLALHESRPLRS